MRKRNDGKKLENDFAKFGEKYLNFTDCELREHVNGREAKRSYEVDIHGMIYKKRYKFLMYAGYTGITLSVLSWLDFIPEVKEFIETNVADIFPWIANYPLPFFAFVAILIGGYAKKKRIQHVWVECKDWNTATVKRKDIEKLNGSVDDVRKNSSDKQWHPDTIIIVSSSGFDQDALSIANKYGIVCYEKSGRTFKEVDY